MKRVQLDTPETRYFVTSIDPGQVRTEELLAHVRNHWQIENCVFFLKDRWWDEDRHWTRRPGLSEWLADLTTADTTAPHIFRTDPYEPLRAQANKEPMVPSPRASNPPPLVTLQSS